MGVIMNNNDIRRAVLSRPLSEVRIFHRRWSAGLVYDPLVSGFIRENAPGIGMNYAGALWPQIFPRTAAARQRRREQAEAKHRAEMARRRRLAERLLDAADDSQLEAIVAEHGDDVVTAYKAGLAREERLWGKQSLRSRARLAADVLGVAHELRDEDAKRDDAARSARAFWARVEEEDGHFFFH
jgi:hypothetical protein